MTRSLGVDMAPLQRKTMGQQRAYGMISLLLAVLLLPMATAVDSTVSVNTTWSGDMVLSGNVTVASGATLTIAPGTNVDAKEYSIIIEGVLVADESSFFSSVVPETQGSHGQGLWPGIVIETGVEATLAEVTVANASAGVLVRGVLSASDVVFNDAYRGLSLMGGTATVDEFEANRMDYEAVYVETGSLNLSNGLANEVAVGLANHGTAYVDDFVVKEAGVGVQSLGGSLTLDGISVENTSVGIATVSGASSTVSHFNGHGMPLAIDAGDADDFSLSSGNLHGERFMFGQGTSQMHVSNVDFFSTSADEMRPAVDVRCDGQCTLEHTDIHSPMVGVSWSGSGTSFMDNVSVYAIEQAVETSGSGHAVWTNLTVNASTTGLSVQTPTSSLTDIHVELTANQAIGIDLLGGQHTWFDVVVEKAFTSADQTSIGLNAWYSDLTLDQFTSRNV